MKNSRTDKLSPMSHTRIAGRHQISETRYHESGHSLEQIVHSALARNSYVRGRNLDIEVNEDRVVLKGVVGTYYQKQIAQESIRSIDGVNSIRNEIEVISV